MGRVLTIRFSLGEVDTIPKMRDLPRGRIRKIENPSALHIHWVTVSVIPETIIGDQAVPAYRIGLLPRFLRGNRLWRSEGQTHNRSQSDKQNGYFPPFQHAVPYVVSILSYM